MKENNCYSCAKFQDCDLRDSGRYNFEPCDKWQDDEVICPCSTCKHDRPGEDKCAMGKVISIRPIGCELKEEKE